MSQVATAAKTKPQPKEGKKKGPTPPKRKNELPIWRRKYYDPVKENKAKKNPWLIPGKLRRFGHTKNAYLTGRAAIKSRVLQHITQKKKEKEAIKAGTAEAPKKPKKKVKKLHPPTKGKTAIKGKPATTKEGKPQEGAVVKTPGKKQEKWYPLARIPKQKLSRSTFRPKAPKIRKSLKPGAILVILAGKFIGNRVVMLRALNSGLLAVTGPKKFNQIGLRRVHPSFVLATSTVLDFSSVKLPNSLNDRLFVPFRQRKKAKKSETEFFKESEKKDKKEKKPRGPNNAREKAQKAIDSQLIPLIKQTDPLLPKYLGSRLRLENGQYPHLLKF